MRYSLTLLRTALRLPRKGAQIRLLRDLNAWLRVEFLGAASHLGIAKALATPLTTEEITQQLGYRDTDLLNSFLELGASLRQLRRRGARWELRGSRLRALPDADLDGMAGMLEEVVTYEADVYRRLGDRLRGEPPGDYLAESAATIARASRLAEVVLLPLVDDLVRRFHPASVLDVGCGTGIYLRAILEASAGVTAAGVDVEPEVIEVARGNLDRWGIGDRATISVADIRELPPELERSWNLILLFQNIYYFPPGDRPDLLSRLRNLAPDGTVAVATAVAGANDALAAHLDVVLRSTKGSFPLPTSGEMRAALAAAGFNDVEERRLAPRQPLRAFIAR